MGVLKNHYDNAHSPSLFKVLFPETTNQNERIHWEYIAKKTAKKLGIDGRIEFEYIEEGYDNITGVAIACINAHDFDLLIKTMEPEYTQNIQNDRKTPEDGAREEANKPLSDYQKKILEAHNERMDKINGTTGEEISKAYQDMKNKNLAGTDDEDEFGHANDKPMKDTFIKPMPMYGRNFDYENER